MDGPGQRKQGPPTGGRSERVTAVVLFVLGLWVAFSPSWAGWGYIRDHGLDGAVSRLLTGFLFLFVAGTLMERHRTQRAVADIHEALNMLLYGRNFRRDREAVRILLAALRSKDVEVREKAHRSLRELTGCDFALDPEVWESWWKAAETRFSIRKNRAAE